LIGPGHASTRSEIIMLPSLKPVDLSVPVFPANLHGYVITSDQAGIGICGGWNSDVRHHHSAECFHLSFGNDHWLRNPSIHPLNVRRDDAASAMLGQEWWVAGGNDGSRILSSTELRGPDGKWKKYVKLPAPTAGHCMVTLDENRVLLAGGRQSNYAHSRTYIFDRTTGLWERKQNMLSRREDHSCALVDKNKVIMTGGVDNSGLSTTEVYSLSTDSWSTGPDLPKATEDAKMITVDGVVYHVGGRGMDNRIYSLDLSNPLKWKWIHLGNLKKGKILLGMVELDSSTLSCNGWK